MINPRIEKEFNDQIKHEIGSAYLYLSMAAWFDNIGWDGMASWMKVQAQEEMVHAMKFYTHIVDREGKVALQGLEQPKVEWASPLDAFQAAYKHEQFVTSRIQTLAKVSAEENDYISTNRSRRSRAPRRSCSNSIASAPPPRVLRCSTRNSAPGSSRPR